MKVQIEPVTVFPDTATQLEIFSASIRGFSSASIIWNLMSSDGMIIKSGLVEISGSEYEGWNDDFPYLTDLVISKLGLTLA